MTTKMKEVDSNTEKVAALDSVAARKHSDFIKILALVVFLISGIHVIWSLCDYSQCFQDNEVYGNWAGKIFLHGKAFSLSDLRSVFDFRGMAVAYSPRFLSYLSAIWTLKLRLVLWNFLPPHPSFSPIWLFSLLLAPWLLYRFLRGELACRWLALLGVGLYMASAGYLSSATMLFHPAKPLANFAIILTLYVAMRIAQHAGTGPLSIAAPRFSRGTLVFLIGVLPIMLLSDETALFSLAIIPIWNFRFFFPSRLKWPAIRPCLLNTLQYCIPAGIYLVVTFVVTPLLCQSFFGRNYDFGSYLLQQFNPSKFNMLYGFKHLTTLLVAALAPWPFLHMDMPVSNTSYSIYGPLLLLAAFVGISRVVSRQGIYWETYVKAGILMLIFLVFQTFVAAHHPLNLVVTGYYYGAIFSVLLVVLLTSVLGTVIRTGRSKWFLAGLVFYLLLIQTYNFSLLNNSWIHHNNSKIKVWFNRCTYNPYLAYADTSEIIKLYAQEKRWMYEDDIPALPRYSRMQAILNLWHHRDAGYRESLPKWPLALGDMWALTELYYRRTPARIPALETPRSQDQFVDLYLAALLRTHQGQPDEELLPVLAFRMIQGEQDEMVGFDTKLSYPWFMTDLNSGVQHLKEVGFTHVLVPVSGLKSGSGSYWTFHHEFLKAFVSGGLGECGLMKVGQVNVAGQEIAVMKIL